MLEFLDPNTWHEFRSTHEFRIYLDDSAQTWVVVDEDDFLYFSRWRWHVNKPHPQRNGTKKYAVRNPGNGRVYRPKLYLHVEIMKMSDEPPPSELHTMVDHRDGDELNCRRYNLRWATPSMNRNNICEFKRTP